MAGDYGDRMDLSFEEGSTLGCLGHKYSQHLGHGFGRGNHPEPVIVTLQEMGRD